MKHDVEVEGAAASDASGPGVCVLPADDADAEQQQEQQGTALVSRDALLEMQRAALLNHQITVKEGKARLWGDQTNLPTCYLQGVVCDEDDFVVEM